MKEKRSNLVCSLDLTDFNKILDLLSNIVDDICAVKLHIDIIENFSEVYISKLKELKIKHNFLVIEDRKFADIGNTISYQFHNGIYKISDWADIVTVHAISGGDILNQFTDVGILLIAQMSNKNNLIDSNYTQKVIEIAKNHKDKVLGFITQEKLSDDFLNFAPGINIDATSDGSDQKYSNIETMRAKGIDVFIVGRGIYKSSDPIAKTKEYRELCYI